MNDNIQNYVVFEKIGQGGFGQVFRAKCKTDDREYAIKFITRMALESNAELKLKVEKEVTIHSQLLHPCILELASCFEDENFIYLVLELCHNKDLKTYLKSQKRLKENEVRSFVKQIVDGLRYLHRHGILHRDITLANILLTSNNCVKIADFGLAIKLNKPDEKDFGMCGTPNYIAPEVASRRAYGLEADVWSLGCIMYTLLVGRPPFEGESIKDTLERVINDKFHIPDYVSSEAKKLINAILKKNPKERLRLDEILNHPFFVVQPSKEHYKDYSKSKFGSHGEFSHDSGHDTLGTMSSVGSRTALNDDTRAKRCRPAASQQQGNVESSAVSGSSRERTERSHNGPVALKSYPNIAPALQQSNGSIISDSQPISVSSVKSYPDENARVSTSSDNRQRNPRRPLASKNDIDEPPYSSQHYIPSSDAHLETENRPSRRHHGTGSSLPGKHSSRQTKENVSSDSGYDNYTLGNGSHYVSNTDSSVGARSSKEVIHPSKSGVHCSNSKPDVSDRGRSIERKTLARGDSLSQKTRSQSRTAARGEEYTQAEQSVGSSSAPVRVSGCSKSENKSNHPEMVLPPPINTARLRPQRQKTKFAVLSILDDGWVCLEFFKAFSNGEDWVTDVLRISPDGLKIEAFAPGGGKGCILQSQPPEIPPRTAQHGFKQFSYDRLPKSYWKKYLYASRFANLVRSRTPKITYYIPEGKVTMMENVPDPDLEVIFSDGVTVTKKNDEMQIVLNDGSMLKLKDSYDVKDLPHSTREKYETVNRVGDICRQLESVLIRFEVEYRISCFPVTLNRAPIRPPQENASRVNSSSEQLRGSTPSVIEGPSQIRPHIEAVFSNQSTNISNGQLTHSYSSRAISSGPSDNPNGKPSDVNRGQQWSVHSSKR